MQQKNVSGQALKSLSLYIVGILSSVALLQNSNPLHASSSIDATVTASVVTALTIDNTQGLDFGTAVSGEGAKVIGATANGGAASFVVRGEGERSVNVQLPEEEIFLTPVGDPDSEVRIRVHSFVSDRDEEAVLSEEGQLDVNVGAVRDAIPEDAPVGAYQGSFTVTVVY